MSLNVFYFILNKGNQDVIGNQYVFSNIKVRVCVCVIISWASSWILKLTVMHRFTVFANIMWFLCVRT